MVHVNSSHMTCTLYMYTDILPKVLNFLYKTCNDGERSLQLLCEKSLLSQLGFAWVSLIVLNHTIYTLQCHSIYFSPLFCLPLKKSIIKVWAWPLCSCIFNFLYRFITILYRLYQVQSLIDGMQAPATP